MIQPTKPTSPLESRISAARITAAVVVTVLGCLPFAVAFFLDPFLGVAAGWLAGWLHRSSCIYYEPSADPIARNIRDDIQKN